MTTYSDSFLEGDKWNNAVATRQYEMRNMTLAFHREELPAVRQAAKATQEVSHNATIELAPKHVSFAQEQLKNAGYASQVRTSIDSKSILAISDSAKGDGTKLTAKDFIKITEALHKPDSDFLSRETAADIVSKEVERLKMSAVDAGLVTTRSNEMDASRRAAYGLQQDANTKTLTAEIHTPLSKVKQIQEDLRWHADPAAGGKNAVEKITQIDAPKNANEIAAALNEMGIKATANNAVDRAGYATGKGYVTAEAAAPQVMKVLKEKEFVPSAVAQHIEKEALSIRPPAPELQRSPQAAAPRKEYTRGDVGAFPQGTKETFEQAFKHLAKEEGKIVEIIPPNADIKMSTHAGSHAGNVIAFGKGNDGNAFVILKEEKSGRGELHHLKHLEGGNQLARRMETGSFPRKMEIAYQAGQRASFSEIPRQRAAPVAPAAPSPAMAPAPAAPNKSVKR